MKKTVLFFLLIIIALTSCNNKISEAENVIIKNDLTETNLKGNVKSINLIQFEGVEKFGDVEKVKRISLDSDDTYETKTFYNKNGFMSKLVKLDLSDSVIKRESYTYDINNNKLEEITYYSNNTVNYKRIFKYDSLNNLVERDTYNSEDSLSYKSKYEIDEDNNNLLISDYHSDGVLNRKRHKIYDSIGNMIAFNIFDAKGKLEHKYTSKFDSLSRKVHSTNS
jgi:hypothetical protein